MNDVERELKELCGELLDLLSDMDFRLNRDRYLRKIKELKIDTYYGEDTDLKKFKVEDD